MKKAIFLALLAIPFSALAEKNNSKDVCHYNKVVYTEGSIISMEGILRECRDGAYEHEKWMEQKNVNYMPLGDSPLKWRKPILSEQDKVST